MLLMLVYLSKDNYLNYVRYVQLIDYGLILVSCGFALYREDGLALHDLFAGTRVIKSSERNLLLETNIKEAKVVEVKDTVKKSKGADK